MLHLARYCGTARCLYIIIRSLVVLTDFLVEKEGVFESGRTSFVCHVVRIIEEHGIMACCLEYVAYVGIGCVFSVNWDFTHQWC